MRNQKRDQVKIELKVRKEMFQFPFYMFGKQNFINNDYAIS